MSIFRSPNYLRRVLLVDATTCALTGLLMTAAAGALADLTAVPSSLLSGAGVALLPIAAFIAFVATRAQLSTAAVWLIIVGNAAWVIGSIWLLADGIVSPNALGYVFVGGQALAVAVLAELEFFGVRALTPTAA